MRVTYNKLVRDRIPEIIEADGHHAVTHILDGQYYRAALLGKLVEEAREAQSASADELPNELADVWEVLQALLSTLPMTEREFVALAASKRSKRSSFNDRIFLEYTEHRIVPRDQLLRRRFAAATDRQEPRSPIWPGTYRARARLSGSTQAGPMSVIGRPWTPPHGGELHLGHL